MDHPKVNVLNQSENPLVYYLYSSVSIKSWPCFPRSREINAMYPVPKTPAITFFLITILLIQ